MTDFAERVFNEIEKFFSNGGSCNSLLKIACLGNPERTIQGSLFEHLSKNNFAVVLEMNLGDTSADIAVFENELSDVPDVIIELKHRSPFQTGGFNSLLYSKPRPDGFRHDMFKDYFKSKSINSSNNSAIILIGAATTIYSTISDEDRNRLTFPFLKTKGYAPKKDINLNKIAKLRADLLKHFTSWPMHEIEKWYGSNTLPKDCIPPEPKKCFYRLTSGTLGDIRYDQTPTSDLGNNIKGSVHAIGFMWN